jgi:hypothetical protein
MLANIPAALWGDVIFLYNQELLRRSSTRRSARARCRCSWAPAVCRDKAVDTILGAPAFASELCEAARHAGDIIAIAPSQYHLAEKGGAQIATSLHVRSSTTS